MTPTSTPRSAYLCNLAFIVGLGLLLLNDHVLKATYGNWFTGKLSDVAGLLIFPLFLQFVFATAKPFGPSSLRPLVSFFGNRRSPMVSSK